MEYHVQIDEALVLSYLSHPDRGLAPADLDKLLGLLEGLAQTGEVFRGDLSRRRPPDSYDFEVTFLFEDGAGKVRAFRFIISDAAAVYGVLRVRFAEEL